MREKEKNGRYVFRNVLRHSRCGLNIVFMSFVRLQAPIFVIRPLFIASRNKLLCVHVLLWH